MPQPSFLFIFMFKQLNAPETVDCWKWTFVVILLQVVVWQKAKVPDHRSALVATLGPGIVVNLLPCHHQQEHPEVSFRRKMEVRESQNSPQYENPNSSPLILYYFNQPPLRPICPKLRTNRRPYILYNM